MYFVAVVCPPPLNERIHQYKLWMKEQFGCVVAMKSPAHITLIPPFWLSGSEEERLLEVLQSFSGAVNALTIHLDGFSHFGKRVLFVAVEDNPALALVKQQTEDHFIKFFPVIKRDTRPFHPHITIANRDMKPSYFEKAWEYFSKKAHDGFFVAKEITLLKLTTGRWNVISEKTF